MARHAQDHGRPTAPLRVVGISAGVHPPGSHSTSRQLLDIALAEARRAGADVRSHDLTETAFRSCPAQEMVCSWPCRVSLADPDDRLQAVYENLVDWADVVLISSAVEGGALAEPMQRFLGRLRCIRHELDVNQRLLVRDKVAGFLLCGPRDPVRGRLIETFGDLGFTIPPFPIAGPPPDSCIAAGAEGFADLVRVHPESADGAAALMARAMDVASRIAAAPRAL